eukprot:scaffold8855_cov57-Phaeocystis_antarctica.AAC.1
MRVSLDFLESVRYLVITPMRVSLDFLESVRAPRQTHPDPLTLNLTPDPSSYASPNSYPNPNPNPHPSLLTLTLTLTRRAPRRTVRAHSCHRPCARS